MTLDIADAIRSTVNDENRGVSPVIGVILMVAITVILAAVIATFVLGLGEQVSGTAPRASFTFDYDASASDGDFGNNNGEAVLTITHGGGDTIKAGNLFITGSSPVGEVSFADDGYNDASEIQAGDGVDIAVNSEDTITVVWRNDKGNSASLSEFTGPDA